MVLKDKSQRFGTTEISDPSYHLDIFDRLYEGNLIITKRLTDELIIKLLENKEKIILHVTCTGLSKLEPNVPSKEETYEKLLELLDKGFPVEQVVLRVDPIIPTEKGINTAISVINLFQDTNVKRVRISFLDMYNHVKERFKNNNIPLPYDSFHANEEQRFNALSKIKQVCDENNMSMEICGEPPIGMLFVTTPCLSQKDIDILGLTDKITLVGNKQARKTCECAGNKTELIKDKPHQCNNKCLYCFWDNLKIKIK